MINTMLGDDDRRHAVARFTAALQGGRPAPVTVCGQYGRQGQPTTDLPLQEVSCEACQPPAVQYPQDVCEGHEFGSDWPCTGCDQ